MFLALNNKQKNGSVCGTSAYVGAALELAIPGLKTASYPGQFVLSELPEEAWDGSGRRPRRIFPTSLTGDVISEIAEDDWGRGWVLTSLPGFLQM